MIADADALNILAAKREYFNEMADRSRLIVTPHLGEMSRLTGKSVEEIRENLPDAAEQFPKETGCICVLKDARTIVSDRGDTLYINVSGNHGMATAGSGDILTGIIAALLAVKTEAPKACLLYTSFLQGEYGRSLCCRKQRSTCNRRSGRGFYCCYKPGL